MCCVSSPNFVHESHLVAEILIADDIELRPLAFIEAKPILVLIILVPRYRDAAAV